MAEETKDYIAVCPVCAGIVGWISGNMERKESAKEVSKRIRQGLNIERVTTGEAQSRRWKHSEGCTMIPKPKKVKS